MPVGIDDRGGDEAVIARCRILLVELPGAFRAIDPDIGMVDDLCVARTKFHSPDIAPRIDGDGHREYAKGVGTVWRERIHRQRQDHVRRTEKPTVCLRRLRRQVPWIAFNRTLNDPLSDRRDLPVAQRLQPDERAERRLDFPGRHDSRGSQLRYLRRMLPCRRRTSAD